MEAGQERWFVHFRGHSLGPISTDQLKASLRQGELGPNDKVAAAKDSVWRPLASFPELAALAESSGPRRVELTPPPPPSILLKKKRLASPLSAPSEAAAEAAAVPIAPKPEPITVALAEPVRKARSRRKKKRKKTRAKSAAEPLAMVESIVPPPTDEPAQTEENIAEAKSSIPERPELEFPMIEPVPAAGAEEPLLELFSEWRAREREAKIEPLPPPAVQPAPRQEPKPEAIIAVPERPPTIAIAAEKPREIHLEIRVAITKQAYWLIALSVLLLSLMIYAWNAKKTRDPEGFRPPDPSSPTALPPETSDPFPSLKDPTHPRRD